MQVRATTINASSFVELAIVNRVGRLLLSVSFLWAFGSSTSTGVSRWRGLLDRAFVGISVESHFHR